jgi:hypothetical protein
MTKTSRLQFFGVWSDGAGATPAPISGIEPTFVNLLFDVNETSHFPALRARGFGPILLHVRSVLFMERHAPSHGLRPDYRERWNHTLGSLIPLIDSGAAMGVFLGDELCWDCISWVELKTAADLVRATLPPTLPSKSIAALGGSITRPIVYYNEAFPVLDDAAMWNASCGPEIALPSSGGGFPFVPPSIDWVSMDYCVHPRFEAAPCPAHRVQLADARIAFSQTPTRAPSSGRSGSTVSSSTRASLPTNASSSCRLRTRASRATPHLLHASAAATTPAMARILPVRAIVRLHSQTGHSKATHGHAVTSGLLASIRGIGRKRAIHLRRAFERTRQWIQG